MGGSALRSYIPHPVLRLRWQVPYRRDGYEDQEPEEDRAKGQYPPNPWRLFPFQMHEDRRNETGLEYCDHQSHDDIARSREMNPRGDHRHDRKDGQGHED